MTRYVRFSHSKPFGLDSNLLDVGGEGSLALRADRFAHHGLTSDCGGMEDSGGRT